MSEPRVVWFVNHYATNQHRDGRSGRHEQFARRLPDTGWRAVVISASTDHPSGRQTMRRGRLRERFVDDRHDFVWLRGVSYARVRLLRVADVLLFTALLLVPGMLNGLPRPDVVVGGSVHPPAAWAASLIARRLRVPFVYEPRDLWPETLVQFGSIGRRSPIALVLAAVERHCVRRAVVVVSPLEGAGRYFSARGLHAPFAWVPNGVSRQLVDDIEDDRDTVGTTVGDTDTGTTVGDTDTDTDTGTGTGTGHTFEIAYLGSMGTANSLVPVVDAFCLASDRLTGRPLVLRLVGTGPDRRRLEERAAASGHASRIVFEGHLPQSEARAVGRRADALIANLRPLDLYRHGTSLNKFFEYLLLAKPVVLGASVPRDPITDSGAGVRVPGDDVPALADAICRVATLSARERLEHGARGRRHVLAHYDYDVLVVRLAAALDQALSIPTAPPRRPGAGR